MSLPPDLAASVRQFDRQRFAADAARRDAAALARLEADYARTIARDPAAQAEYARRRLAIELAKKET